MTTTTRKEQELPEQPAAKPAKIMTLPLPQILDELESYIQRVDEAVKQAKAAAKESRDAADRAQTSGEKAAEAARKAAETAVAKVKEEAAKTAETLNTRIITLEKELNDLKEKSGREAMALDNAFRALQDAHHEGSPFME